MKKRYLLILLLLFFFLTGTVLASTDTCDREKLENYGVTKFKVTDKIKEYVLKSILPLINIRVCGKI